MYIETVVVKDSDKIGLILDAEAAELMQCLINLLLWSKIEKLHGIEVYEQFYETWKTLTCFYTTLVGNEPTSDDKLCEKYAIKHT